MDFDSGEFYLGRKGHPPEPVTIKADSLTTHDAIVDMTGSGKTGLGVNMLEEALLNDIPTLIIDPKGNMGIGGGSLNRVDQRFQEISRRDDPEQGAVLRDDR